MERLDPRGRAMLRAYRRAKAPAEAEHDALWARIETSLDEGAAGPGLEPLPATRSVAIGPVVAVIVAVAAVVVAAFALQPGRVGDATARRAPTQAVREVAPREPAVASSDRARAEVPAVEAASPPVAATASGRDRVLDRPHREPLAPALAASEGSQAGTKEGSYAGAREGSEGAASEGSEAATREGSQAAASEGSQAAASEGSAAAESDALLAEMALVHEARQALRGDRAARALELLDAHARAFPTGQMREDRQVLRIEALCATGKAPQARAEAALFLRAFPGSAHAQRVRASCAER